MSSEDLIRLKKAHKADQMFVKSLVFVIIWHYFN
jgi:hypothetical protein